MRMSSIDSWRYIISKIRPQELLSLLEIGLITLTTDSEEWDSQDWLADARNLINWSNSIESQAPLLILVRHSHRVAIRTLQEMSETGITSLGEAMAIEFGRRLPTGRHVEIHHSFIPRCEQTAQRIAEGIKHSGGKVRCVQPFDLLLGPIVSDMEIWEKVGDDGTGVARFVASWERGEFGDGIEPFMDFSKRLTIGTLEKLKAAKPSSLYIYVTHDLFLMGARKTILKEEAHIDQRPPYLGGFALSMVQKQTVLFEARTAETFDLVD